MRYRFAESEHRVLMLFNTAIAQSLTMTSVQSEWTLAGTPSASSTNTWKRSFRKCKCCFESSHPSRFHLMRRRFQTLEVVKVNTYGIVLRWQGSDPSLSPVLLAAHQGQPSEDFIRQQFTDTFMQTLCQWSPPPRRTGNILHTLGTTMVETSVFYRFCN